VIALLFVLLALPKVARAHALDDYLQATYITITPTEIEVELNLTPGVLLASEFLLQLDPDGDGAITEAEAEAYVANVVAQAVLEVDGQALALVIDEIEMPSYLNLQAGYGSIRIFTSTAIPDEMGAGSEGTHALRFVNNFAPAGATYQVNAFVETGGAVTLGPQNRDSTQQSISVEYTVGSGASPTPYRFGDCEWLACALCQLIHYFEVQ
jgi:hypothetical protein